MRCCCWLAVGALLVTVLAVAQEQDDAPLEVKVSTLRAAWLPAGAQWTVRSEASAGRWEFRSTLRRGDGELGALPHAALWAEGRLPGAWLLSAGDHRAGSAVGAALGIRRGNRPGAMDQLVTLGPGSASRSAPEERGLALRREAGAWRGGILLARTRRDLRRDGAGFLLDLEHADPNRWQQGAWRDELGLGWLTVEGPWAWELQGLAGQRRDLDGRHALSAAQLVRRHARGRLQVGGEWGESRVMRLQGSWRRRSGWLQLDAWRGRRVAAARYARSQFPLGEDRNGGGLHLQAGLPVAKGGLALELRWLEAPARREDRAALRWDVELSQRDLALAPGLAFTLRHTAADARPHTAAQDRWALAVEGGARAFHWRAQCEDAADAGGHTRSWRISLQREWRRGAWKGGVGLALSASRGDGPLRLVPVSLAPGLLHHAALGGARQHTGLGGWLGRGGHRLAAGLSLRESGVGEEGRRDALLEVLWSWSSRGQRGA